MSLTIWVIFSSGALVRRAARHSAGALVLGLVLLGLWSSAASATSQEASADLTHLSIEELMTLEVTSAAKQTQKLADAAAAVFVITQDDIRRSGATSIPEVLRLAPGVQVARVDANKWAITIRGFNGRYANKLLVLVDGRSIYTPIFAGVYWEIQDLLMEDIERIEVVRGPGASLWGANAVNGVINILTKRAADTKGLISATVGNQEQATVGIRVSGQLSDKADYRLYGKYLQQAGLIDSQGKEAEDDWREGGGGFLLDWTPANPDSITVQGGVFDATLHQNLSVPDVTPPYLRAERDTARMSGRYLQGRWEHTLSESSRWSLQLYYQNLQRQETMVDFDIDIFDLDFQHLFNPNEGHSLIWGMGYRHYQDNYQQTALGWMTPTQLDYDLLSVFVQDQISVIPQKLELTLGGRLEHNDFSGWEFQPNGRLLWKPHPQHRLWASVSRAVRSPSRGDDGVTLDLVGLPPQPLFNLPATVVFQGNSNFVSEKVTAYEVGYRTWPTERFSFDVTAFYNDYDDLRAIAPQYDKAIVENGHLRVPGLFVNASQGETHGFEVAANWQLLDRWRLQLAYSYLQVNLNNKPGFPNLFTVVRDGSHPRHQVSLLSSFDIRPDLEFDLWLRHASDIPDLAVGSPTLTAAVADYFSVNARLGWRPRPDLELSLAGANLLGPSHGEFIQETYPVPERLERSVYGQIKWSF